jgi:hypothetical protein
MVLRLAGEAGQVSLALTAGSASARASVDQHAAEIRDALAARGRPVTRGALLSYAQGFTEAAIARGWWPPHRRGELERDKVATAGMTRDATARDRAALDSAVPDITALHIAPDVTAWSGAARGGAGDTAGGGPAAGDPPEPAQALLDWESLRLAAICRMLTEATS